LLFLLLPGTFLGVWNLIAISYHRGAHSVSPAWIQAHVQAQMFGWIGTFIIGIGFYSLSKMGALMPFVMSRGWQSWALWTAGATLHWLGGVCEFHWRLPLPLSGFLMLGGFLLFFSTVRRHQPIRGSSRNSQAANVDAPGSALHARFLGLSAVECCGNCLRGRIR